MQSYHYQAALILLCNFINGFSYTVNPKQQLFPYASSMVMSFGLVESRNDTGYYVGLIASVTMLGRAISAPFWGHMADVHGRKPIIEVSLASTALVSFLFAFVPNYPTAVLLRFLLGSMNSIAVVAKTAASECVPKSFVSTGMMLYSSGFFIGEALGTGFGGLMFGVLSESFPYAFPNLFVALASAANLVLVRLYFYETLPLSERSSKPFSFKPFFSIINSRLILLLLNSFALNCYISTSFQELVPLVCWAEKSYGGLRMDPQTIGELLTVSTTLSITIQQFIYSSLVRRYGGTQVTLNATKMMAPLIFILSFSSLAGRLHPVFFIIGLVGVYMLIFQVNTGLFVLMNEAVSVDNRGKLNGIGILFCCGARSVAAISSGSLFAWSLSINSFPADHHLVFFMLALTAFTEYMFVKSISRHVSKEVELTVLRNLDESEDSFY
mmetsp:Transcript_29264/g.52335  ORF Transcript_29264/g.52335 Transcript_29264/m.52335 type:complete len:440 (-) Transcript_29264:3-1322(-)